MELDSTLNFTQAYSVIACLGRKTWDLHSKLGGQVCTLQGKVIDLLIQHSRA